MITLGISGLYHDSAAALIEDGHIVAAAQEERFTRKKNDASFPRNAIRYCLGVKKIELGSVDAVVYYDNPVLSLDRFIKNALSCKEDIHDLINFQYDNMFTRRLMVHRIIRNEFGRVGKEDKLLVANHHKSHAASAFYASPYKEAAILTIDGVGEWNTTTIGLGRENKIELLKHIDYPHSLGMLYSAFTYFCGFKVNSGEYKLMGLAPYGEPSYYEKIISNLIDIKKDGSFRLNLDYFDFQYGRTMINKNFVNLFGMERRQPESRITKEYMDVAASIQKVTEKIVIKLAETARGITGIKNLVLAGGIALNCVANGKILEQGVVDDLWIQPAAGDAGGAIGAAYLGYYEYLGGEKNSKQKYYNTYLGPKYTTNEIEEYLAKNKIPYTLMKEERNSVIAKFLNEGKVVGLFQGRMEMGPRALGNRSIIASAMDENMQSKLNLKIKFRESFRPFAPSVLYQDAKEYFNLKMESPYMLLCAPVSKKIRTNFDINAVMEKSDYDMIKVSNMKRSDISAVTHVDFSARIQTVTEELNKDYYDILQEYKKLSGCSVICNTSFNIRGEPIVCTPQDAYICFMRTGMDVLVLEDCLLLKEEQPKRKIDKSWRKEYALD